MHVVIVGGGIGGLTLAMCLHQLGIGHTLLERGDELRDAGTGIGIWTNAVAVLDRYGLGDEVRAMGDPIDRTISTNLDGLELVRVDLGASIGRRDSDCFLVHRPDFHRLLASRADPTRIRLGAPCVGFSQTLTGVTVHLADGGTLEGDVLVAADGVRSMVRRELWGDIPLRFCGPGWRGIANKQPGEPHVNREIHGRDGERFGLCPMGPRHVYWWATHLGRAGDEVPAAERKARLRAIFAGWPFEADALIEATPDERILYNDMVDIPPLRFWGRGRITLLGDAAHPTTPNLAQGGCMAVEEAGLLARLLQSCPDAEAALRAYERLRIPRARMIVNTSHAWGRMSEWRGTAARRVKEVILRSWPRPAMAGFQRKLALYDLEAEVSRGMALSARFAPSAWET